MRLWLMVWRVCMDSHDGGRSYDKIFDFWFGDQDGSWRACAHACEGARAEIVCVLGIMVDMTERSAHDQCARMGGVNTHKGAWISSRRARVPKERLKG